MNFLDNCKPHGLRWITISAFLVLVAGYVVLMNPRSSSSVVFEKQSNVKGDVADIEDSGDAGFYLHEHDGVLHRHSDENRRPKLFSDAQSLTVEGMVKVPFNIVEGALSKDNSVEMLVSALLWCDDSRVMDLICERAKTDPLAAAAVALFNDFGTDKLGAEQEVEHFVKLSEGCGLSRLLQARLLISSESGDGLEKAEEVLETVYSDSEFNNFSPNLFSKQKELLGLAGFDVAEVGVLLGDNKWTSAIIDNLNYLSRKSLASVDEEDLAHRATVFLDVIDGLRNSSSGMSIITKIKLNQAEEMLLRRLPDDIQMMDGTGVAEMAQRLSEETTSFRRFNIEVKQKLKDSPYSVAEDYYSILLEEGKDSARMWLLGR